MIHSELHRSGKFDDDDDDEVEGVWKEVVKTYSESICQHCHTRISIPT